MSLIDIKLGFRCNNNCFHCVVEPQRKEIIKSGGKLEYTYKEILEFIDSNDMGKYNSIVLTGGEPTIRPDFLRIVKYIHKKYPQKRICLQTNGRQLWRYLDAIKEEGVNIFYVIAIHGPEEIHNEICNAHDRKSNPFQETMKSIRKVIELYGSFKSVARIEIVLSRKNLNFMKSTVEMLYEMGANRIGISYPHLDGYEKISSQEVLKRGFPYAEMQQELKEVIDYAREKDLQLEFEAVPMCALRDEKGKIYDLPSNVTLVDYFDKKGITVITLNERQDNFRELWRKDHAKYPFCKECIIDRICFGIWVESLRCFGGAGLKQITPEELPILKETLKRHCISFKEG